MKEAKILVPIEWDGKEEEVAVPPCVTRPICSDQPLNSTRDATAERGSLYIARSLVDGVLDSQIA